MAENFSVTLLANFRLRDTVEPSRWSENEPIEEVSPVTGDGLSSVVEIDEELVG